ncbi:MAG: hypothetical protein M1554_01255 [Patescibacteria group bacterium]|jgi:hypothetical protein|nr:hypothetical protein [Patescibacteria group bacterium]
MDDIRDILTKRRFNPPDEIVLLKKYIQINFDIDSEIINTKNTIIIKINSASVASILRTRIDKIKSELNVPKKIQIIIT